MILIGQNEDKTFILFSQGGAQFAHYFFFFFFSLTISWCDYKPPRTEFAMNDVSTSILRKCIRYRSLEHSFLVFASSQLHLFYNCTNNRQLICFSREGHHAQRSGLPIIGLNSNLIKEPQFHFQKVNTAVVVVADEIIPIIIVVGILWNLHLFAVLTI